MTRLRFLARVATGLAILAFCFAGHGLTRLFGIESRWPHIFLHHFSRAMGLEVHVIGHPIRANVLYVANHLSWLDILAIGGATGASFISKNDVAGWPLIGLLARIGGTIFVDRQSRRAARGHADEIGAALVKGRPITLFPEGTTNDGHGLFPFRAALFASVAPPPEGILVQPIAIDYGAAASEIAWYGDEPAGPNAMRVLGRRGRLDVRLHFLAPLAPSADRKLIAAQAQAAIEQALPASA